MLVPDNHGEAPKGEEGSHTLYYFPFSLYSILVRFALELGQSLEPATSPTVRLRLVDLHEEENLTEEYLTISSKGQVPVLSSPPDSEPPQLLEESRDILAWLCSVQPQLLPPEHYEDIGSLLEAFFAFHAKPLAVRADERSGGIHNKAAEMLERTDISESHRRRLEIKSIFHDTVHGGSLNPENVQQVEAGAQDFIKGLSELISRYRLDGAGEEKYVFGRNPTVLDAIATTLLARLMDMQRDDLMNDTVREYAIRVMATDEWRKTTQGRPTIYDASLGRVADMELF